MLHRCAPQGVQAGSEKNDPQAAAPPKAPEKQQPSFASADKEKPPIDAAKSGNPAVENAGKTGGTSCQVCWDAEATHAFIPCGHQICCGACAAAIKKPACDGTAQPLRCIYCRQDAADLIKIFSEL